MKNCFYFVFLLLSLASCSLKSQFNLKSDQTGNFLVSFDFNKEFLEKSKAGTEKQPAIAALPTTWTNMYDYLKLEKKDSIMKLSEDSLLQFKRLFMRFRMSEEQSNLTGFDIKMDSIGPNEWNSHNLALNYMTQEYAGKTGSENKSRQVPFTWDGKQLQISTGNKAFSEFEEAIHKLNPLFALTGKSDNAPMIKMIRGVFGNADFEIVYTFVLDKKIKSIKGKHDFVKKVNATTIEVRFKVLEMIENASNGKKLKHKDELIVVKT